MELVDPVYWNAAEKNQNISKHRWLKYGAFAACLCIVLGMLFWGMINPVNTFSIKAYALEADDNGKIALKETDFIQQSDIWGGHFDDENFYVNIGFRYDGNHIKCVDFTTEDGFFAKQYISNLSMEENVSKLYVGADSKLVMYGEEFEIVGKTITLNDETMTDDLLLFWGTKATKVNGFYEHPEHATIKATATFYDGKTQEIIIPIDLSGPGAWSCTLDEEEIQRSLKRDDYYKNLPLEDCELLVESIQTVTDVYEVDVGGGTSWIYIDDINEFDKDGIYRGGTRGNITIHGDYEIYIPVVKRDENGNYTGMLYRVPEDLHYQEEK